jgi:signal transduction histidine kinase
MPEKSQLSVVDRYKQLIYMLHELASILNTDQILEYIVDASIKLCNAEAAWILFPDPINRVLYLETGQFINDANYKGLSIPIDSSLEGGVFSTQQPELINDANVYDNRLGDLIRLPGVIIKSIIIVPLTANAKKYGVIEVANKHGEGLTSLDQMILISFANQAAITLDNSHRFLQSDLVAEFVHELRTPLAALNTALNLLQRDDLPHKKYNQIHQMIQTEFNRLTDLTTSFLDYARLESGRANLTPTRFDLNQLIRDSVEVMQMHADENGVTIALDLPEKPLLLTADKDKIKQVILNLLNNAIIYNRMGGIVDITASVTSTNISFSLKDNGPVIPPENLLRLFERFYRVPGMETGSTGSGLGLTICKQIVEAHKGKIEVSSMVGQGTTFTVQLPTNREI